MTAMTTLIRRAILVLLCSSMFASVGAQERAFYRTYHIGDNVLGISRQLGVSPAAAALRALGTLNELTWRAQYPRRGDAPAIDPVSRLVFTFYEDQLFRIVIDYSPDRTEEMTEGDMVEAVSKVYGPPARRTDAPNGVRSRLEGPADSIIAQWIDGEQQVALLAVRGPAFRMVVTSTLLQALANAATADEAAVLGLDSSGAERPRAGIAKSDAGRAKIRRANIASFIP